MATYTDYTTLQVSSEDPARIEQINGALENPIAIIEGASGAPRIQTAALYAPTAGTNIVARLLLDDVTTTETAYALEAAGCTALVAGTIRVAADIKTDNVSYLAYVDIRKNGTSAFEDSTNSTTYVEKTTDIAVAVGDRIGIYLRSNNVAGTASINDIEIRSGSSNMAVA